MTQRRIWLAVLVTAALLRLLTLGAYPLHDTTEARYAEIARIMVVNDEWVTPQIEQGVPFWAKPPLSTWTIAATFKVLGINEFAARLPELMLTLLTLVIVYKIGRRLFSAPAALAASVILLTTVIGFIAAGAVMTDAALLLSTTIALGAFCVTIQDSHALSRYGLFIGLGIGLLAKGPIVLVLAGLPILVWTLWQKNLLWLWRALPWVPGTLLTLMIAGPWYLMAEIRTPGFLEYFLVGEHLLRFVDSGWEGDMYGYAHSRPRGTIWLYGFAATVPWSLLAIFALWHRRKTMVRLSSLSEIHAFLLLWAVSPMVFFTFAGNILPAYVLPGVPAFALLLGHWASGRSVSIAYVGLVVPGLIAVASITGLFTSAAPRSQKDLTTHHYSSTPDTPLYYFPKLPHSGSFYSNGRAKALRTDIELANFIHGHKNGLVAIRSKFANRLSPELRRCLFMQAIVHDYALFASTDACRDDAKLPYPPGS